MGMNDFAPFLKKYGCFVVRNITPDQRKTIKIFQYPINYNQTRDLLQIPGVGEADIRASLLKGELRHKILAGDILVECSDIDLLQFNLAQKVFLQSAGIVNGMDIGVANIATDLDNYISAGGAGGVSVADHEKLRQLIHFIDSGGPAHGFTSGAFKTITPTANPFPTNITWWVDSSQTEKIVEKIITYNGNNLPATITHNMYGVGGLAIVQTVIDTITYVNNSFESSRTRTII